MSSTTFSKDPQAVLDYRWDWSAWLDGSEAIDTYTVTAKTGIDIVSDSATTTAVTAWVGGGTVAAPGPYFTLTCHVTTTTGRQDERTIRIRVTER